MCVHVISICCYCCIFNCECSYIVHLFVKLVFTKQTKNTILQAPPSSKGQRPTKPNDQKKCVCVYVLSMHVDRYKGNIYKPTFLLFEAKQIRNTHTHTLHTQLYTFYYTLIYLWLYIHMLKGYKIGQKVVGDRVSHSDSSPEL